MAISPFQHKKYPCPHCGIGNLHPRAVFYCAWHEGQFVSAPDFPAWVCDVCGLREYDQEAVFELDTILSMDSERRGNSRRQLNIKRAHSAFELDNPGRSREPRSDT